MTQSTNQARRTEGGFTLVELAIVMIIIGLLIGGILKGQELITNARVSSTTAQIKAVESGISGFRDKYAGIPGDIATPTTRLPGCIVGTICAQAGNGDGLLSVAAAGTNTYDPGLVINATSESITSFVQLAAAGFVGGVNGGAAAGAATAGTTNPTTPLAGAWVLATSTGAAGTGLVGPANVAATALQSGAYVALSPNLAATIPAATGPLTPVQAASIDRKVDDGNPNTGTVRATGAGGAATAGNCANGTGIGAPYNENLGSAECGLYAKVM